jgi:hypothetical protein
LTALAAVSRLSAFIMTIIPGNSIKSTARWLHIKLTFRGSDSADQAWILNGQYTGCRSWTTSRQATACR